MKTVNLKGQTLSIKIIIKPSNKHMYLRVKNDTLVITSPTKVSDDRLYQIINDLKDKLSLPKKDIENKIHYLGKEYNVIIKKSFNDLVYINDNNFIIETTNTNFNYTNKLTEQFYNNTLKNIVGIYANDIKNKFKIKGEIKFEYKYFKSIFGRCFTKGNKIQLSSKLAKYELKYIILTIYHEFAHFKVPNHQKEYYDHIISFYPKYREVHKEFKKIQYNELFLK